jgi:hypothetical protein
MASVHDAPETIWLQVDPDGTDPTEEFLPDGATWCQDKINGSDVEYVRADVVESLRQQLAECQADNKRLRDTLGLWWGASEEDFEGILRQALAVPCNSTALDTMLAAAELKGRREALLELSEWCLYEERRLHGEREFEYKVGVDIVRDEIKNRAKELE